MAVVVNTNILSDGLIYSLDAANFRSYSGSGLTAYSLFSSIGTTLVNGTGFSTASNGYFSFDGTNDYISVQGDNFPLGNSPRSVNIWFYTQTSTWANVKTLFWYGTLNGRQSFGIDFSTYPLMRFFVTRDNINWNSFGPQESWKNVQVTYDGNLTCKVYEAGILVTTKTLGASLNTVLSSDVQIGAVTSSNGYFNSYISQVSIYNRALSAIEIKQNFNATRDRYGV